MKLKLKLVKIIGAIFLLIGIGFLFNWLSARIYHLTFSNFFLLSGILFSTLGIYKLFLLKPLKDGFTKKAAKVIHIGILLVFISFLFIETLILSSSFKKDLQKPDYIVILGAGLWNSTPSLMLTERLDASLKLINTYPDVKIIVSGGQGPGETISEAEAMKHYLINKGITSERILKEDKSTSTLENLTFTKKLIQNTEVKDNIKITIVTNDFHVYRAKLIAKRLDFNTHVYSAPTAIFLAPTYYIREYFALSKALILDK